MATEIWVNIGSGNWLQAITWTNVDWSSVRSRGIHRRALSWEDLMIPISKTRLKITFLESHSDLPGANELTHWGLVMHNCYWIGSSLVQILACHDYDDLLSTGRPGTNFSEIWVKTHQFSFKKMHLKMMTPKCQPFCLGVNVFTTGYLICLKTTELIIR